MTVKELFDAGAGQYDGNRRKVIPCFDDLYGTLLELVPFASQDRFAFLDLGAGTGLVSSLLLDRFPKAEAYLLDVSDKMMEKARERFSGRKDVHYFTRDYDQEELPGRYQLVVSAMSIHHLPDPGKLRLIHKILDVLNPGGMFINAELILGATAATEKLYQKRWLDYLERSDLQEAELARIRERMGLDRPATLEQQLGWMRAAGFDDVDCFFKHYNFAVYAGKKPGNL